MGQWLRATYSTVCSHTLEELQRELAYCPSGAQLLDMLCTYILDVLAVDDAGLLENCGCHIAGLIDVNEECEKKLCCRRQVMGGRRRIKTTRQS